MFVAESQDLMLKNLASLTKSEFLHMATGYAATGLMPLYPDTVSSLEKGLKERIQTLDLEEAAYVLRMFAQAQLGSSDGLYSVLERHIGRFGSSLEPQLLYPILKSFSLAHQHSPGFDA